MCIKSLWYWPYLCYNCSSQGWIHMSTRPFTLEVVPFWWHTHQNTHTPQPNNENVFSQLLLSVSKFVGFILMQEHFWTDFFLNCNQTTASRLGVPGKIVSHHKTGTQKVQDSLVRINFTLYADGGTKMIRRLPVVKLIHDCLFVP